METQSNYMLPKNSEIWITENNCLTSFC